MRHTERREGNCDKAYVWVFCKWPWVSRFTSLRTAVTQGRRIGGMSHRDACGWSHVHVDSGPVALYLLQWPTTTTTSVNIYRKRGDKVRRKASNSSSTIKLYSFSLVTNVHWHARQAVKTKHTILPVADPSRTWKNTQNISFISVICKYIHCRSQNMQLLSHLLQKKLQQNWKFAD